MRWADWYSSVCETLLELSACLLVFRPEFMIAIIAPCVRSWIVGGMVECIIAHGSKISIALLFAQLDWSNPLSYASDNPTPLPFALHPWYPLRGVCNVKISYPQIPQTNYPFCIRIGLMSPSFLPPFAQSSTSLCAASHSTPHQKSRIIIHSIPAMLTFLLPHLAHHNMNIARLDISQSSGTTHDWDNDPHFSNPKFRTAFPAMSAPRAGASLYVYPPRAGTINMNGRRICHLLPAPL